MTAPTQASLLAAMEATWPPLSTEALGPWTIREGDGGGQRVSAATAQGSVFEADIQGAEKVMRALGQKPLFCVYDGQETLDQHLAAAGYVKHDPVALYAIDTAQLTDVPVPPVSAFDVWPPLAIMVDLWAEGGIGAARMRVMARVDAAKTGILARHRDQPAGVAFVATHGSIAMIHAIDVTKTQRRQGVGTNILRKAAHWAQNQGATSLALAVTRANFAANRLYTSLGMRVVGYYHYRVEQDQGRS